MVKILIVPHLNNAPVPSYQFTYLYIGAKCNSMVRAYAHGAIGCRIDPSWSTHWALSHSRQFSTTGVTKAGVCAILCVGWCI